MRLSTALPAFSCIEPELLIALHAVSTTSIDSIRYRIPSQHITIKSYLPVSLNFLISGSLETIFLIPPNSSSLASMSPMVLETESLPGYILNGPSIFSSLLFSLIGIISVRYILPPAAMTLSCSLISVGLWSLLRLNANLPPSVLSIALESPTLAI